MKLGHFLSPHCLHTMPLWVCWMTVLPCWTLALAPMLAPEPRQYQDYNFSKHYESPVLESLQCYNDYISYIQCSWTESAQIGLQLQASPLLHHLDLTDNSDSPCLPYGAPVFHSDGRSKVHCQYNTTMFYFAAKSAFFFSAPCSPLLSRTFTLSRHVRVRPPLNLSQELTEDGGVLLHWKVPYTLESPLYPTLNYQVNYRRHYMNWEVIEVSEMKLKIETDSLVPGFLYEARVRARGGRGPWSEWSPLVQWKTKNAVLLGPANLHCVTDGELEVSCTWEVSKELAQFVTYRLSYRHQHSELAQFCKEQWVSANPGDLMLKFRCSFPLVSDHEELLVDLIPIYLVKTFPLIKNILLPRPSHVQVEENSGDWVLRWSMRHTQIVPVTFEVRYWSTKTPKDVHHLNFSKGVTLWAISSANLKPSTLYQAQVRVMIAPSSFEGKHSEWTEPVQWTTHPAPWPVTTIIYTTFGVCVAILSFILFRTLPASYRRIRLWYLSIPSPVKSKVLSMMKPPSRWPVEEKELDHAPISTVKVLDSSKLPQTCSTIPQGQPMLLIPADEMGLYKCISQQGWEVATDLREQHWESQPKDTPSGSLAHPFTLYPSGLPLLEGLTADQLCSEDDPYQHPDCVLGLSPCVSGYVEVPLSVNGQGQEAPQRGRLVLQTLLDTNCPDYTPAAISSWSTMM